MSGIIPLRAVCTVGVAAGTVATALLSCTAEQIIFSFFLCAFQYASAAAGARDFFQLVFADYDAKNQAAVFTLEMNRNDHIQHL